MTLCDIILSTLTGVAASYFVWWLTFKYLVPKIRFAENISRIKTTENNSGFRYRLKFENSGSRNIIDLQVLVRLRIKGIRREQPNNWEVVYLPTTSLDYKNVAIVRPVSKNGQRCVLEIKSFECDYFQRAIFPENIRILSQNEQLSLDDILNLENDTMFQILILGYDEFSGARKFYESKFYTHKDIKNGNFDPNGLGME